MRLPPVKALVIAMLALLPAAPLLLAPSPAAAQIDSREGIALRDQILQLRHEVEGLRAQVANGGGGSYLGGAQRAPAVSGNGTSDMVVQLLDRMNGIEDEIRTLRGRIDELQNNEDQKIADLGKQLADLKFAVEHPGMAGAGPQAGGPAGAAKGTLPAPPEAPHRAATREPDHAPSSAAHRSDGALAGAYAALDRGDYAAAEHGARAVLAHRAAPEAYDAQFLLAEALAGQHQWSRAAIAYDDAYNRSKQGAHAPAALLGLALSLTAINEHRAACETLAKLHAQYPRQGTALKNQAAAIARRAGCR